MSIEIKITPEMKRKFSSEVAEHLNHLEKMLLILEKDPHDQEAIHSAFRAVHTIKGNSDYIGIKDINLLAHELEDLMDYVRNHRITMTEDTLSLLFEGLDLFRDMNHRITKEDYQETDISFIADRIRDLKGTGEEEVSLPNRPRAEVDVKALFARSSLEHIEYIRKVTERILAGESMKGTRKNVLRVLKTFRIAANYVGAADIVPLIKEMEIELHAKRSLRKKTARYLLDQLNKTETLVTRMREAETLPDQPPSVAELSSDILEREIKVAPEKVDEFLAQVSELIIAKNTLNYVTKKITAGHAAQDMAGDLRTVAALIDKLSNDLQDSVMKLRLVRINSLFERLPRIVRDLSRRSKKKIELSLLGGETEIDRKVIEQLTDPMIHLIRNAVDHGIELPAERLEKDKPESGTITVKAHQEGSLAIIEVVDDGRGLHINTIRKTALKKKIMSEEDLTSLTDEEIINLIFAAGFSTTRKATLVSGRGVGLDVVKTNVNSMGGNVTLQSEEGIATRVRLQVPVSMAVMDALLTEVAGEQYAFPFASILESITVRQEEIQVLNNREAVHYRGTVLALQHLREILGVTRAEKLRTRRSNGDLSVIVVTFGGQVRGVVVDRILRREGILAKPLEQNLAAIKEFSGAALLGDGSIALILDPMGLF